MVTLHELPSDDSFFGEFPNPDPDDETPPDHEAQFLYLVVHSNKCHRVFKFAKKLKIFVDALSLSREELFLVAVDQKAPNQLEKIYTTYHGNMKNKNKWKLMEFAKPLFRLSKHVFELHQARAGKYNSKAMAIAALYEYYNGVIEVEEANRQAGIAVAKKATVKVGQQVKSLPDGFKYYPTKLALFDCPGCNCKSTVIACDNKNELNPPKEAFEASPLNAFSNLSNRMVRSAP